MAVAFILYICWVRQLHGAARTAQQSRRRAGCSGICAACPEPADMDQQYMGHVRGTRALDVARECLVQNCVCSCLFLSSQVKCSPLCTWLCEVSGSVWWVEVWGEWQCVVSGSVRWVAVCGEWKCEVSGSVRWVAVWGEWQCEVSGPQCPYTYTKWASHSWAGPWAPCGQPQTPAGRSAPEHFWTCQPVSENVGQWVWEYEGHEGI